MNLDNIILFLFKNIHEVEIYFIYLIFMTGWKTALCVDYGHCGIWTNKQEVQ